MKVISLRSFRIYLRVNLHECKFEKDIYSIDTVELAFVLDFRQMRTVEARYRNRNPGLRQCGTK